MALKFKSEQEAYKAVLAQGAFTCKPACWQSV